MQPPQPWLDCAGRQSVRQLSAVPLPTKNPEAPWNKDDRSALVTQPSIWFGGSLWACTAPEAIARNAIEAIVRVLFVIDFLRESLIYQSDRSLAPAACCGPERRSAERIFPTRTKACNLLGTSELYGPYTFYMANAT